MRTTRTSWHCTEVTLSRLVGVFPDGTNRRDTSSPPSSRTPPTTRRIVACFARAALVYARTMSDWKFEAPREGMAVTTKQVMAGAAIVYVSHDDDDGAWQFHTAEPLTEDDALLCTLGQVLDVHPSMMDLADLQPGWIAERANDAAAWVRKPYEE